MQIDRLTSIVVAVALASLALTACGESVLPDDSGTHRTKRNAVTVVPKFELTGTEKLPDELQIEDLGLAVSEIDLTPIAKSEGVAYSNSEQMGIDFEVDGGETTRKGRELVLPDSGKFDVSLRLEPERTRTESSRSEKYSFRVSGYIAGDAVVRVDSKAAGEQADGDPIPFPASPDPTSEEDDGKVSDQPALPKQWTRFEYRTDKSVVYTLDKVEFVEGKQVLSFTFDAQDWAMELMGPLARAVQSNAESTRPVRERRSTDSIDVTKEIDKFGEGPEAFADHVSVQTSRPKDNGGL